MSSAALLCRSNCLLLNALHTWRKVTVGAGATTTTTTTSTHKHTSNQFAACNKLQHPQKLILRAYQTSKTMDTIPSDVFQGVTDRFSGVTVDASKETLADKSQFSEKLQKSLAYWIAEKKRTIWFRVYKQQADWVPILAEAGFDFHHARTGVVTMYRWLPTDESINLPNYAHTLLGVGGLVINDRNEVLVVSDKNPLVSNIWKLPGGYVEPRENFIEAACREVIEETGIRTTFSSMVCLRHSHGGNFGCSDIYVVIGLKPLNLDIKRCEREIERAQWMPLEEYMQHPQVLEGNRHFVRTYLDYKKRGLDFTCSSVIHQVLKREYKLYYVEQENHDKNEPKL